MHRNTVLRRAHCTYGDGNTLTVEVYVLYCTKCTL